MWLKTASWSNVLSQLDTRAWWRHSRVETCSRDRQYKRTHALRYTVKILCWRAIDAVVAISLHFHTKKRFQNIFLLFWRYHVLDSRKQFQTFWKNLVLSSGSSWRYCGISKRWHLLDQQDSVKDLCLQQYRCENPKSLPFTSAVQGATLTPNAVKLIPPPAQH